MRNDGLYTSRKDAHDDQEDLSAKRPKEAILSQASQAFTGFSGRSQASTLKIRWEVSVAFQGTGCDQRGRRE